MTWEEVMNTIAKLAAAVATAVLAYGITACGAAGTSGQPAARPTAAPPAVTFCHGGYPAGAPAYCGVKPTQIYFSGDTSLSIRQITWSSWTASGAAGTGLWYFVLCNGNCPQAPATKYPATLTLSAVRDGRFTVLAVTLKGTTTVYRYPEPWALSARGCLQSPYCDQPAGPSSSG
jgi:hypothetical protein